MADLLHMDVAGNMDGYRAMSSEELTISRLKKGKCTTCGRQCFKINRFGAFKTKKALNVVGSVANGRCLRCNHRPEDIPIAKITQDRPQVASTTRSAPGPVVASTKSLSSSSEHEGDEQPSVDMSSNWKTASGKVMISNFFKHRSVRLEEVNNVEEDKRTMESESEQREISEEPPPAPQETEAAVVHENPMVQMLWDTESFVLVIELMNDTHEDVLMQKECCKVIANRVQQQDAVGEFISHGAILYILDAIEEHFQDTDLLVEAFNLIQKVCAASDVIKDEFSGNDGVTLINRAFLTFCESNPDVVQSGCRLLCTFCSDEKRTSSVEDCGVVSWCLRFLWCRSDSTGPEFLAAEQAVADLLAIFAKHSSSAKAEIDGFGLKTPQFSVRKMIG